MRRQKSVGDALLAGVIPLSAGQTASRTVDLSPGRYVWDWDYFGETLPHRHKEFVVE